MMNIVEQEEFDRMRKEVDYLQERVMLLLAWRLAVKRQIDDLQLDKAPLEVTDITPAESTAPSEAKLLPESADDRPDSAWD